jgi:hypothetical protein
LSLSYLSGRAAVSLAAASVTATESFAASIVLSFISVTAFFASLTVSAASSAFLQAVNAKAATR